MNQRNRSRLPWLVVSDGHGNIFEIPGLEMVVRRVNDTRLPEPNELIPVPPGSLLLELPDRAPIGYDRRRGRMVTLKRYRGRPVIAAAVFLAPAYTQLYFAAFQSQPDGIKLPLFAYTPLGWQKGQFWTPAVRVDADVRHDPSQFDPELIEQACQWMLARFPGNRLVAHLIYNCVQRYFCPNAQNFVLERWEYPVPISPACNARCVGCISQQPNDGVPATQNRIDFVPTVEEIVEYTVPHLEHAPGAIISFGQGCEGEPLLQGDLLEQAVRKIRSLTELGTIHVNTNAGYPHIIERLCRAGADSFRVSLNSAQPDLYTAYYRPKDYGFEAVLESMAIMRRHQKWISLNYFIFPGLTDDPIEMEQLVKIITDYRVDFIQMRNLNIDPDWYIQTLKLDQRATKPIGILKWQQAIVARAPWIRFGYFNPAKESWKGR